MKVYNCRFMLEFRCPNCKKESCPCNYLELQIGIFDEIKCECGYIFMKCINNYGK